MLKRAMAAVALAAAGLAPVTAAMAADVTLDTIGDTLAFSVSQGTTGGLSGDVTLELTGLSAQSATFSVTINNTSGADNPFARLVAFGVETINPELSKTGTSADGGWFAQVNENLAGGATKVDLCVIDAQDQNCNGSNAGVAKGGTETFNLTLATTYDFTGGITFTEPFYIRFQSTGLDGKGSIVLTGSICTDGDCTPPPPPPDCANNPTAPGCPPPPGVPEPASLALMGVGLLGIALARRRRR